MAELKPSSLRLLVVEDDEALRDALVVTLEAAGHDATGVADGPAALEAIARERFELIISDLRMAPMDGLTLLAEIRALAPRLPVLLMTAFGDVDKAVAAMRGGACDFLLKPFEPETFLMQIERYAMPPQSSGMVAEDQATRDVLVLAERVAATDATVLLCGESGSGKEVFARFLHERSPRAQGPFVAINCAAIPDSLLEATLFGHEKGAYTGAQSAQAGKFEQASGGTLLLDEISEMPLALQAKLLRVLQEREVERVGGRRPVPLDIRVLATSNRDMAEEVKQGRFREDLFYRLNVFPIAIPALRQRPGDILPLARHFLAVHGRRLGTPARLAAASEAILAAHPWPGNVRELENVVQRALILAPASIIEPCHLMFARVAAPALPGPPPAAAPAPGLAEKMADEGAQASLFGPLPLPVADAAAAAPATMKDLERQHILETLQAVGGSRLKAVQKLGISERTLRYKLKQYRDQGLLKAGMDT